METQLFIKFFILIILTFALFVAQAYFFGKLSGRKVSYSISFSTELAYEGDDIYIIETLENKKLLPVMWLRAEITTSKWLDFAGPKSDITHESRFVTSNFFVWGNQKITRKWFVKCLKRGIYKIDSAMLVWGDLFGLRESAAPVDAFAKLTVYPTPGENRFIANKSQVIMGDILTKRWINDDPFIFSGVRKYDISDPMNRIHWKATAKAGELMVRKNDYTTYPSFLIVLNVQSSDMDYKITIDREEVEKLIKTAAALIDYAVKINAKFGLVSNGFNQITPIDEDYDRIKDNSELDNDMKDKAIAKLLASKIVYGNGKAHADAMLNYLAGINLKVAVDYEHLLEEAFDINKKDMIVALTTYKNDKIYVICETMRKRGRQVLY